MGKLILKRSAEADEMSLSLRSFGPGVFVVQVSDDQTIYKGKVGVVE